MAKLRTQSHARMLGNGMCTGPVDLDCRMESACETCAYFKTGSEFVLRAHPPTRQQTRDLAHTAARWNGALGHDASDKDLRLLANNFTGRRPPPCVRDRVGVRRDEDLHLGPIRGDELSATRLPEYQRHRRFRDRGDELRTPVERGRQATALRVLQPLTIRPRLVAELDRTSESASHRDAANKLPALLAVAEAPVDPRVIDHPVEHGV